MRIVRFFEAGSTSRADIMLLQSDLFIITIEKNNTFFVDLMLNQITHYEFSETKGLCHCERKERAALQ